METNEHLSNRSKVCMNFCFEFVKKCFIKVPGFKIQLILWRREVWLLYYTLMYIQCVGISFEGWCKVSFAKNHCCYL